MKKKNLAVQATALAPIGANPIMDFFGTLPREASLLGMKGHRTAGKTEIYVNYCYDGKNIYSTVSWEGGLL